MPEENRVINGGSLKSRLRAMGRGLEKSGLSRENRLFERELQELLGTAGGQYFPAKDKTPLLGARVSALDEISDGTVRELIQREQQSRYVGEEELNSLLWQSKFCLIKNALADKENAEKYIGKMYALKELDERETEKLSPLHAAFEADEIYRLSSPDTKRGYRSKAAAVARSAGIDEERYTRELMKRAETENEHLGAVIQTDFRRVFPRANTTAYFIRLFGVSALTALAVGFFTRLWMAPVAFLPVFGVIKPINDLLTARLVRAGDLPRMDMGDSLPENGKTACVLSALVSDEKTMEEALQRLRTAKLKNPAEGIYFVLLCDLPAADSEKLPEDNKLFGTAERLRNDLFPESVVIFRRRSYSDTMRKWQGFDRKRGAVEELVKFMCGKRVKLRTVLGDAEPLKGCEFIVALDFDTVPLMDSIKELAAIALHPLNKDYGIIAPRSTSTLDSTLKTGFSRLMAGNGGVSGISAYDSFCGEFYFDCFGEGIFCGKGLIRKEAFLRDCCDKFPPERVLSHDILEGGLTGVAYAGDVEFSDSFPASSRSFFKRAHRWIRGDFQNLRFLFKKGFSPLTRFKLFDNFRRGISPVLTMALFFLSCFLSGGTVIGLTAYLCVLLPFLPPLISSLCRGFAFGITRRFYSPIISETAQLAVKALAELMTLPKAALTSLDAGWKTLWRNLVSKRKLLEWTTFGLLEKSAFKGGFWHLLPSFALSLLLLAGCVCGHKVSAPAALVMCAALPVLAYCDRQEKRDKPLLGKKARQELLEQTEKMWHFYTSYVNKETNFLPPDNVQYYPVYRVCPRTSPTNIGMYLLSAVCVCELGLINEGELTQIVENSVESVEKLAKWRGNLYNWYDVRTLKKVSEFVSSVDSGNFVCCLVAVRQRLSMIDGCEELVSRCDKIIENTRLSEFYCKKHRLFSIGVDPETGELSKHRYDMLMSEARLMSYFAIASGQAPKEHWRALSRTMSRSGRYAGAIAWTGTMFEFYMPELLLTSKEGSMTYEALKFAFHCQKRRHQPFGISESGYYAFDREWNYQYKAHGVQKTALKGGMNSECVVSPYSSYLTLSREPLESWNNLVRLEKEGAFDPEFGFYEAVDYTRRRVGDKAVVKSHMAHHVGMSIAGAANTLKNNVCSELFMSSDKMRRAEELLEERVMPGEKILKITDHSYENRKPPADKEEISRHSLSRSPVNALGVGELTLYTSANGRFCGSYKGLQTVRRSRDFTNRPAGAFYGYFSNRRTYPFVFHPALGALGNNLRTVFSAEESEYSLTAKDFDMTMTVSVDPAHCAEIRSFYVRNKTRSRRQLTLCAYSEPVLARENDYRAHPMFMDLFLNISYDRENKLFLFHRKDRNGGVTAACAAGFMQDEDFTYNLSREECTDYRPFSFFEKAPFRECSDGDLPSPCLFIKADISVDAGESRRQTMFYCYGDTVEAAKEAALELRKNGIARAEPNAPSPLALSTVHGRMGSEALPALLYGEAAQRRILDALAKNTLDSRALWRYGISGDLPLIVCEYDSETLSSAVLMKQGLEQGGIDTDLVILCENGLQKSMAEGYGHALVKDEIGQETMTLIYALAAKIIDDPEPSPSVSKLAEILPILPVKHKEQENGFAADDDNGYVVGSKAQTWCNVLANPEFGTLVSQNSLGFTWALNSRENKLTPWSNDLVRDSTGEMLLLKKGNCWYDLVRGSKAVFSPQSCTYEGVAEDVESSVTLGVYSEGMGKEITLTLLNNSDAEQQVELAYRLEPILGGDSERTSPVARIEDNTLITANPRNPYFKGAMAVCCNKKASFLFSRDDFARGELSCAKTEGEGLRCDMTAVIVPLKLPPRGKERIRFILGYCLEQEKAAEYVKSLDGKACGVTYENEISIACPDGNLNRLFNTWLPHQALSCRLWARTGFFQNGGAYGFRDQLQDCLAIMYHSPKIAEEHIYRCAGSQFKEGDVLHWWHELGGKRVGVRTRYSDDLLWLPYAACEYADSFAGEGFWEREIPYCAGALLPEEKQELFMETETDPLSESLYLHCRGAIEKGFVKGDNGLIKIGCGDWNDGYNNVGVQGKGESVWLSMFYVMCGRRFAAAARENGDAAYAEKLEKRVAELCVAIEENGWDGDWYIRAFYDDGSKMGSKDNDACRIDLLPQAFAALCGLPDTARAVEASNAAWNELVDRKNGIIKLFSPPFAEEKTNQRPGYVMAYPEGVRENGGQYTHAAVWYCLSCFRLGQNKRAFQLLNMLDPAAKSSRFGREPYFMTADIYTNPACYGRGGWSMYTGAAAWYWLCIFEGLFGAKVRKGKLLLSPNLPPEFSGAVMKLRLCGTEITLHFVFSGSGKTAETTIPLDGKIHDVQVFY